MQKLLEIRSINRWYHSERFKRAKLALASTRRGSGRSWFESDEELVPSAVRYVGPGSEWDETPTAGSPRPRPLAGASMVAGRALGLAAIA